MEKHAENLNFISNLNKSNKLNNILYFISLNNFVNFIDKQWLYDDNF